MVHIASECVIYIFTYLTVLKINLLLIKVITADNNLYKCAELPIEVRISYLKKT
jgi:hypothetical protein